MKGYEKMKETSWMWISDSDLNENEFVEFRREFYAEKKPERLIVRVSADSRYKLYVNGLFVEFGPSKGNKRQWYYDEIDLAGQIHAGMNEITVMVLHYSIVHWKGNGSVFRTKTPGLFFEIGEKNDVSGYIWKEWQCRKVNKVQLYAENPYFAPLWIYEKADASVREEAWTAPYDYAANEVEMVLRKENMKKRTIPFMRRTEKKFTDAENITIDAEKTYEMILDAGELQTAFLTLMVTGGKDAVIHLLQCESYAGEIVVKEGDPYGSLPKKGDRTDASLKLYGYTDVYKVKGSGTDEQPEIYAPFWMRTFRYVKIRVTTGKESLKISGITYEETGYPLEVQSSVKTSDPGMEKIWDISERTLRRCMQETYTDCPFYEQLQYAMDARSQILYTYAVSADPRLAMKCMDDFSEAVLEDGMINCSYPNYETNVIPGFGIYYIGIVYDYMMYFGEKEQIQKYMPVISRILDFFGNHLTENGLVGKVGGLNQPGNYWSFIDWTKEWDATNGVPPCTLNGPITMESLLYAAGLAYAAEIEAYLGNDARSKEYRARKEQVQCAVRRYCMGVNGMLQDGPGVEAYSQHCQVFGILTDTFTIDEGGTALKKTLEHPEEYAQCSIAMMYYLFRALEKCGKYEMTGLLWNIWQNMVENHLTTCAEDQLGERSDCHAWGALPLYELPSVILGVRPGKPGYGEIIVNPNTAVFDWAEGKVITPKGLVEVKWKKAADGAVEMKVRKPEYEN